MRWEMPTCTPLEARCAAPSSSAMQCGSVFLYVCVCEYCDVCMRHFVTANE